VGSFGERAPKFDRRRLGEKLRCNSLYPQVSVGQYAEISPYDPRVDGWKTLLAKEIGAVTGPAKNRF
jgi:hypothetical protein